MLTASSPSFRRTLPRLPVPRRVPGKSSRSPGSNCVRFRQPVVSVAYAATERTRSPYLNLQKNASCSSFYEILGISMGATNQEIKGAYRRLARIFHPDVLAIDRRGTSNDEFIRIQAAYSTLSDPVKRADYDRKLFQRHRPAKILSSASDFSGYTCRNWETDQCW